MALHEMALQSIIVGAGPMSTLLVLKTVQERPQRLLPIMVGRLEAATISLIAEGITSDRPTPHDITTNTVRALGGRLLSATITQVKDSIFYTRLEYVASSGAFVYVDARPSDAILLCLKLQRPLYVTDEVLKAAAIPNLAEMKLRHDVDEMKKLHSFVDQLSPDDFENYCAPGSAAICLSPQHEPNAHESSSTKKNSQSHKPGKI